MSSNDATAVIDAEIMPPDGIFNSSHIRELFVDLLGESIQEPESTNASRPNSQCGPIRSFTVSNETVC